MSMSKNWLQLKIIEYQNKILTDEINTNMKCELHMTDKKQ